MKTRDNAAFSRQINLYALNFDNSKIEALEKSTLFAARDTLSTNKVKKQILKVSEKLATGQ